MLLESKTKILKQEHLIIKNHLIILEQKSFLLNLIPLLQKHLLTYNFLKMKNLNRFYPITFQILKTVLQCSLLKIIYGHSMFKKSLLKSKQSRRLSKEQVHLRCRELKMLVMKNQKLLCTLKNLTSKMIKMQNQIWIRQIC